jgi:Leucine-rich repeat (LRR) protein
MQGVNSTSPLDLKKLSKLRRLGAQNNQLSTLPPEITQLEVFHLSHNPLCSLPIHLVKAILSIPPDHLGRSQATYINSYVEEVANQLSQKQLLSEDQGCC